MNRIFKFKIGVVASMLFAVSIIFCGFTSDKSGDSNGRLIENVCEASGSINGHEYVDLGLPSGLKWATCNVGVFFPEEYGNYYAWGEIKTKPEYTVENSETNNKDRQWLLEHGYIGENGNLTLSHDAAHQNWGGTWRIPTYLEIKELINNTTSKWTTYKGVKGCLVKSLRNGNCIFFPAAGWRYDSALDEAGLDGYYWSSTPYEEISDKTRTLDFYMDEFYSGKSKRYGGYTIRPVSG